MKSRSFSKWFYGTTVIFSLQSCYYGDPLSYTIPQARQQENLYHNPSISNAPLLGKQNDVSLSYTYSTSSNYISGEVQAAYMVSDNVGIAASTKTRLDSYKLHFPRWEVGGGYVKQLSPMWHFETYAGFGAGSVENIHATGASKFNTNHFYLQPAIAIHNPANTMQLAFVSRFMQTHYKFKDSTFKADRERYTEQQVKNLINDPNHLFWEPGLMLKFGWRKVLFNLNYTISTHLGSNDFDRIKNNFSAGIAIRLNTVNRKKEATGDAGAN